MNYAVVAIALTYLVIINLILFIGLCLAFLEWSRNAKKVRQLKENVEDHHTEIERYRGTKKYDDWVITYLRNQLSNTRSGKKYLGDEKND